MFPYGNAMDLLDVPRLTVECDEQTGSRNTNPPARTARTKRMPSINPSRSSMSITGLPYATYPGPHMKLVSHLFPCKAFLQANAVLQSAFFL